MFPWHSEHLTSYNLEDPKSKILRDERIFFQDSMVVSASRFGLFWMCCSQNSQDIRIPVSFFYNIHHPLVDCFQLRNQATEPPRIWFSVISIWNRSCNIWRTSWNSSISIHSSSNLPWIPRVFWRHGFRSNLAVRKLTSSNLAARLPDGEFPHQRCVERPRTVRVKVRELRKYPQMTETKHTFRDCFVALAMSRWMNDQDPALIFPVVSMGQKKINKQIRSLTHCEIFRRSNCPPWVWIHQRWVELTRVQVMKWVKIFRRPQIESSLD